MSQLSAKAVLSFINRLEKERVNLHAFELRQDGVLRAEGYCAPFAKGQPHRMYSISKSMVSLAIGLLCEDGKLSLDQRISDFFQDKLPPRPDERLMRLTIRDMLRMATCHRRTTYREGTDHDWASTFFTVKPTHEPGTVFHYDTSCSQVLGVLVQRLSGMSLLDFLQERVFSPIGAVDEKRWLTDPSGMPQGGTGLIMSLRDMAKTAQLVMDGGRGIIPEWYLKEAVACQISTAFQGNPEEKFGYGWQFWRTRDGWSMYGLGGQLAIAHPQSGLLLCTIADTRLDPYGVQRIYNAFFDEMVSHWQDESDTESEALLQQKLLTLAVPAPPHCGASLPEGEYAIEENEMGLVGIVLQQKTVRLQWTHGVHEFSWDKPGLVMKTSFLGIPALVSAGMQDESTLRLQCHLIGDSPCGMDLLFSHRGNALTAVFRRSTDPATAGYDGVFFGMKR